MRNTPPATVTSMCVWVNTGKFGAHDCRVTLLVLLSPEPLFGGFKVQPSPEGLSLCNARPVDEVPTTTNWFHSTRPPLASLWAHTLLFLWSADVTSTPVIDLSVPSP